MWNCNCGAINEETALHCPKCNTLKSAMIQPNAGATATPSLSRVMMKPAYLNHLRTLAALNAILAVLAMAGVGLIIIGNMNRGYGESSSSAWIIALSLALEGLLAYGLLNAIADIAENMIEVGSYVRDLKRQSRD